MISNSSRRGLLTNGVRFSVQMRHLASISDRCVAKEDVEYIDGVLKKGDFSRNISRKKIKIPKTFVREVLSPKEQNHPIKREDFLETDENDALETDEEIDLAFLNRQSDVGSYLRYCKSIRLDMETTVFKGTLYEMAAKTILETKLHLSDLQHNGGGFDQGVDLLGKWDLSRFTSDEKSLSTGANRVKPLLTRKSKMVDILVQCKAYNKKIAAAQIREIAGIFHYNVRNPAKRKSTIVFMVAIKPLTKQAIEHFNTCEVPIIFIQITDMKLKAGSDREKRYEEENYKRSEIKAFFMNRYASDLLEGIDLPNVMRI